LAKETGPKQPLHRGFASSRELDELGQGTYGSGKNLLNRLNARGMETTEAAKLARMN
jgi:hypothetical protein